MRLNLVAISLLLLLFPLPGEADGAVPAFQKSVFAGKVQEIAVSENFLLVHSCEGNAHRVTCLEEPSGTILWQKPYRGLAARPALYLYNDRAAVVGRTGESSASLGLRVYHARTGVEMAFFCDQMFTAISRYIVSNSGARGDIIDLLSNAKVFAGSRENRLRLKAVVGNKVLYLTQGSDGSADAKPMLLSLAAFYPFPKPPYTLQTAPDGVFIPTNSRHLFLSMFDRGKPAQTVIHRIPKTTSSWLNGNLSIPSPVYTGATVKVSHSPNYATLSVNAGTLSGNNWTAPGQAGEFTFTLTGPSWGMPNSPPDNTWISGCL